jgi:hypothetical protein
MSDTASRNPTWAAQMLADALLRTVAGTTATFAGDGDEFEYDQSQLGWWRRPLPRWRFRRW